MEKIIGSNKIIGIKILNEFNRYSIWNIEEEFDNYYTIALKCNMATITSINKKQCYRKQEDLQYLYSDRIINTISAFNFAFANFKTITLE